VKARLVAACLAAALLGPPAWAANGYLDSVQLLDKVRIGETTSQQLTEILGPPANVAKFPRRGVEAWSYFVRGVEYSIEIDAKGIVRSVERIVRYGP